VTRVERLDGTVALVTGASSGIGEAVARALAGQGASVALVARRKDRLDELASDLERDGRNALAIQADITQRSEAVAAVREAIGRFARMDTLVNNAGVMFVDPVERALPEEWDRMVALNVNGLLNMARAALPHLLETAETGHRRVADMVNISSVAARHVRVSVIEPGSANTELRNSLRVEVQTRDRARAGIERLEPADVADAVQYIVTRPRRVAVNEIVVRPTEQVE
jgi:NADP-dependent 3-hydroxy acid dehydrogenase YdfG